jgi:hypothetical protein
MILKRYTLRLLSLVTFSKVTFTIFRTVTCCHFSRKVFRENFRNKDTIFRKRSKKCFRPNPNLSWRCLNANVPPLWTSAGNVHEFCLTASNQKHLFRLHHLPPRVHGCCIILQHQQKLVTNNLSEKYSTLLPHNTVLPEAFRPTTDPFMNPFRSTWHMYICTMTQWSLTPLWFAQQCQWYRCYMYSGVNDTAVQIWHRCYFGPNIGGVLATFKGNNYRKNTQRQIVVHYSTVYLYCNFNTKNIGAN